jgi:hypothetical protein
MLNKLLQWTFGYTDEPQLLFYPPQPRELRRLDHISGREWKFREIELRAVGYRIAGGRRWMDHLFIAQYPDAQALGRFVAWLPQVKSQFFYWLWRRGMLSTREGARYRWSHIRFPTFGR